MDSALQAILEQWNEFITCQDKIVAAKDLRKDIMLAKNSEQGKQYPRRTERPVWGLLQRDSVSRDSKNDDGGGGGCHSGYGGRIMFIRHLKIERNME